MQKKFEQKLLADYEESLPHAKTLDREAARRYLGEFTARECALADETWEKMLKQISLHTMSVEAESLSVSREAQVEEVLYGSADFDVPGLDMETVYWSLGFTGKKESVNAPARPIAHRFEDVDNDGIMDCVLTFNAHEVAQFAIAGSTIDTYLRGICNCIRFVAMDTVEFTA